VETFVIEPKEMKRRKRRGKKNLRQAEDEAVENLQDSSVTSSNIVENSNSSGEMAAAGCSGNEGAVMTSLPAVDHIKMEPADDENSVPADGGLVVSPRLRQTRARAAAATTAGNAPVLLPKKTKTWYPGSFKSEPSGSFLDSSLIITSIKTEPMEDVEDAPIVPKREPLPEPDLAVFTGQGAVASADFARSRYEYDNGTLGGDDNNQATTIRQRHARVSDIFLKLKLKSQEAALQRRSTPVPPPTNNTAPAGGVGRTETDLTSAPLPSKVKLTRPPLDVAGRPLDPPALKTELALAPPVAVASAQSRLIARLAETVGCSQNILGSTDDGVVESPPPPKSPPGLLRVVKEIRQCRQAGLARPPLPPLIPIAEEEEARPRQQLQLPVKLAHLQPAGGFFSIAQAAAATCQASLSEFKSVQVAIVCMYLLSLFIHSAQHRQ
jgi:hypothetical protein